MKTFRITYFFLLCIACAYLAPMHAQESCYEQYLREHNKKILTAEDADDSYDELKKTVLAKQMYGDSYLLMVDTIAQRAMITKVDGTYVADVHVALVDSTWYMWLSVDPLADQNIQNSPYMYCSGNPIKYVDPDGRNAVDKIAGIILGSVTNLIPYASLSNLRDAYTPNDLTDYTSTLTIVDNLALAAGGFLTAQGASDVMRGLALSQCGVAVASTGIGAPEGGTIVAIGGKLVGTGLLEATGGAVLMTNALNNLSVGASQNQKGTTNTHQFSDSRRMTENEISQYFNDPNWHKGNYKNAMINKFRKELKGSTNADFYIDTKTNQVYLKGNKSGAWVDTGDTLIK